MSLDTAMCITQKDFHPLLAPQVFFVAFLYALFAYIVSASVVRVGFDVFLRNFSDISQGMAGYVVRILPDGSSLDAESGKLVELFLKHTTFFCRQLCEENLLGVARIPRVLAAVFDFFHAAVEPILRDAQRPAEICRV